MSEKVTNIKDRQRRLDTGALEEKTKKSELVLKTTVQEPFLN